MNEPLPSRLTTRIARLEQACRDELIQNERDRNIAKLHVLTPAERRERMKILAARVLRSRGIDLPSGEDPVEVAARALYAQMETRRPTDP